MSYVPSSDEVERIKKLIEKSNLDAVLFHELRAKRWEQGQGDDDQTAPDLDIAIQFRLDEEDFGIRLKALLKTSSGEAAVSVSGEYSLDDYTPSKRDVLLFANEVAVMTLFPYLREAMSDVTNRVFGESLLLPVAPRGAIAVELED